VNREAWHDIPGWLTTDEGAELQRLAEGKTVLELGAYRGRSTVALALVAAHVVSVDWHQGCPELQPESTLEAFEANLLSHGVWEAVSVVAERIEVVGPILPSEWFDLAWIDSAHDAASVARDTRLALRCLKPGGMLAFHDCFDTTVCDGARAAGVTFRRVVESLAVWGPKGAV
jgi:predicted O-methyltransferase YrrM